MNRLPKWLRSAARRFRARGPYNLERSFAVISFVCIAAFSIVSANFVSNLVGRRMLEREGAVTMQFVQSTIESLPNHVPGRKLVAGAGESPYVAFFEQGTATRLAPLFDAYFSRLAQMPDVIRAQAYAPDGMRIWSTNPKMVGIRNVTTNLELRAAVSGSLGTQFTETIWGITPEEKTRLLPDVKIFAETYFPVWNQAGDKVVGAVELYKMSDDLYAAIRSTRHRVFLAVLAAGLALFAVLYWVVRRAARLIERQRTGLVEAEKLASVGEMASAVAHNIRNPLAAIRSSCEVMTEMGDPSVHGQVAGVMQEVDRAEEAIRALLKYAEKSVDDVDPVDVESTLRRLVVELAAPINEQGIALELEVARSAPLVRANPVLLHEVLQTVLVNALEAMPDGGTLAVQVSAPVGAKSVEIQVRDSGAGIAPEQLSEVFRPFFTTKGRGLGLGLAFARRIVERHGGRIDLRSQQLTGTTVTLCWPAVESTI